MKHFAFAMFAGIMIVISVFAATVNFCMEQVKVYEEPEGIVLELCGNEWLHNARTN